MSDNPKPDILAPQANALDLPPATTESSESGKSLPSTDDDALYQHEESKAEYKKLKAAERNRVITLLAEGITQREIAKAVGVSQPAISYIANRYRSTTDAARLLIHARAGNVASHWLKAVPIAAKKGDHRPARDWLTAAGVVAPEQQQGAHITIQVGTGTSVTVDDLDPFAQAKVITNEK